MRRFAWLMGLALAIGCAQSDSTGPTAAMSDENVTATIEAPTVETTTKTVAISIPGMT